MIDSHCHLNDPKILEQLPEVLKRARQAGVEGFIVPGYDLPSSLKAVELAHTHQGLYAAVGIHPHEADSWNEEIEERLRQLLSWPEVVALGEIGLDYYYDNSPRERQREVFIRQLQLAREAGKPVIIHSREAFLETFEILKEHGKGLEGVFHCFSGSYESAMRIIRELGFFISLGGPVTFPKGKEPLDVAVRIPLEFLLIETDCPYLTPHPHRGKMNEPSYLPLIAQKIEEGRGEPVGEAAAANAVRLFGITIHKKAGA